MMLIIMPYNARDDEGWSGALDTRRQVHAPGSEWESEAVLFKGRLLPFMAPVELSAHFFICPLPSPHSVSSGPRRIKSVHKVVSLL